MSVASDRIRGGWAQRSTLYSFLVLIASLGLPQIPLTFLGPSVLITDLLFLLASSLFLLSLILRQQRFVWHHFFWALACYLAAMLISALFSTDVSTSTTRFFEEGYLICLPVLAINVLSTKKDLRSAIGAWLVGSVLAVGVATFTVVLYYSQPTSPLLEFLTYHYGSVPVGPYPRVTAGFVSASMLCNYLNVSLALLLLVVQQRWLSRGIALTLITAVLLASVFTFSIGLGGLAFALGIWWWLQPGPSVPLRRVALIGGTLVAVSFLLLSIFALVPYVDGRIIAAIPSLNLELMPSARVLVWADACATFLSHPITGNGLGLPVANVVFTNTEGDASLLTDAHNSFLSVAAQNGSIGLIAFVYLVIFVIRRWGRDLIAGPSTTIMSALGLAFLCSFVYQGLTGSFEDSRHLWVLIGMFWAADNIEKPTV